MAIYKQIQTWVKKNYGFVPATRRAGRSVHSGAGDSWGVGVIEYPQ